MTISQNSLFYSPNSYFAAKFMYVVANEHKNIPLKF